MWNLVAKTCKCRCGKTWRALASSTNEYASVWHERGVADFYQSGWTDPSMLERSAENMLPIVPTLVSESLQSQPQPHSHPETEAPLAADEDTQESPDY